MPVFLNATDPNFEAEFQTLLSAKREDSPDVDQVVADIIADVRARGDAALLEYTERFDRLTLTSGTLRLSGVEIAAEIQRVAPKIGPHWNWRQSAFVPITQNKCPKMRGGKMQVARNWDGVGRPSAPQGCMCLVGLPPIPHPF